MISENIEIIKNAFSNYFADGKYFIILLIALLILIVEEEKKANRNFLIYYPILMFIIILNPIFAKVLLKFITTGVYYRFFWTIPIGIIIAYFGTMLISKIDKKTSKILVGLLFVGIIAYSGKFVYSSTVFKEVDNWYKLPDEYVQAVEIIGEIPLENKKAVTTADMIGYVRQLDASISLAFDRRLQEDYEETFPIVNYYNSGDVESLTNLCKEENTNIIVYDKSIELSRLPEDFGYILYDETEHYDIYVLAEDLLSDINIDEETIEIEGIKHDYKLCFINDLHIIVPYDDVSDENKETVQQRYNDLFKTSIGEHPSKLWTRMPSKIDELKSDLVIFGGDMVDYAASSNIECLKNGMKQINQEIMYLRADHDYGRYYNNELTQEYVDVLEKNIDENLAVYCEDLGEILVVGIDNSTNQISDEALEDLKEIFAMDKSIILATHVPLNSRIDDSLAEMSKMTWGDRNLTWDKEGTTYIANDNTKEFLELVYAENSPVKAVLAAHLHFKNVSKLNENITQYVFDASYKGNIGVINIVGK